MKKSVILNRGVVKNDSFFVRRRGQIATKFEIFMDS